MSDDRTQCTSCGGVQKYGDWDESKHPRGQPGNAGQFGPGGGGGEGGKGKPTAAAKPASAPKAKPPPKGAKHPGKGYSKEAYEKNGVIYTSNVDDAARALHENRKVELDQPKSVSVLLDKLGAISKEMIAKGEKAPTFNLCNVTVKGSNLFCAESKGIPRIKMPQLDDEQTKAFRKHLKKEGYTITKEDENAANLRATQNELNGVKVAGVADHLRDKPDHHSKRIIVSQDDYILDGHHHWAAKIGLDAEDNNLFDDSKVKVARVNIKIMKLLELANKFTGGKGAKGAEETTTGKSLLKVFVEYVTDGVLRDRDAEERAAVEAILAARRATNGLIYRSTIHADETR